MERFAELLKELGVQMGVALHPDQRGACLLVINEQLRIQLESDAQQEKLLVSTFISDIPPGKFRENILKDALKANFSFPKNGTLAYSDRNNKLVLFSHLPFTDLNGQKLADFLTGFIEKANNWRTAVATGNTSNLIPSSQKTTDNIFGLKP